MVGKIQFGVYELDRDAAELRKHGVLIRLQEQPFRVLAILAGRPGEIITREELQEQIWGKDTFVDFDQSLNKAVNRVREVLHDDAGHPQYVETVPRRGYRFVAPVTGIGSAELQRPTAVEDPVSNSGKKESGWHGARFWAIGALVTAGALVGLGITAMILFGSPSRA